MLQLTKGSESVVALAIAAGLVVLKDVRPDDGAVEYLFQDAAPAPAPAAAAAAAEQPAAQVRGPTAEVACKSVNITVFAGKRVWRGRAAAGVDSHSLSGHEGTICQHRCSVTAARRAATRPSSGMTTSLPRLSPSSTSPRNLPHQGRHD